MVLRDKDEYSSQEKETSKSEENEDKISEKTYPCEGQLLMIQRNPDNRSSSLSDSQRENVFHTCKILENMCSLIMDNGSCCNCCSTRLVEKLNLHIIPHSKPFKLRCG